MDIGEAAISLIGGGIGGQVVMRIISLIWPTRTEEIDVDEKIQKSLENHVTFLQGQINGVRDENVRLQNEHKTKIASLQIDHNACEDRCSTMATEIRKLKLDMGVLKNASN